MFLIDMGLSVAASAFQFFVGSGIELFAIRLMMGIAIGGEYTIGFPLVTEFAPSRLVDRQSRPPRADCSTAVAMRSHSGDHRPMGRCAAHHRAGLVPGFLLLHRDLRTLTSVYPGEVFATEIRAIGTGFAAAVGRIGAALGTFLLP